MTEEYKTFLDNFQDKFNVTRELRKKQEDEYSLVREKIINLAKQTADSIMSQCLVAVEKGLVKYHRVIHVNTDSVMKQLPEWVCYDIDFRDDIQNGTIFINQLRILFPDKRGLRSEFHIDKNHSDNNKLCIKVKIEWYATGLASDQT
jgi:hypothetical protein